MKIEDAFGEFVNSMEFKTIAKEKNSAGGRYRVYLGRFRKGILKIGAMAEVLQSHGYAIKADKAIKKKGTGSGS